MAGLVPAIHVFWGRARRKTWMPGTSPGMTTWVWLASYFNFPSAASTVSRVYGFWITGASASSSGIGARSP